MTNQKKVLITGASSGIGLTIAEHLHDLGYFIINLSRRPCPVADENVSVNLSQLDQLQAILPSISKQFADIDALISNAGQGLFGKLESFSYPQIRSALDLNFTAHVMLTKALLANMKLRAKQQQHPLDILFMGSEAALQGGPHGGLYCAAKFALRGFSQSLRVDCVHNNIRVTLINPGPVQSSFFDALDFAPANGPEFIIDPKDIAKSVALVLDASLGTVFEEINLQAQKRVFHKRTN